MKRIPIFLILAAAAHNVLAQDTTIYQNTVTLNSSLSNYENVEVVGLNGITLSAGFTYSSNGNGILTANGDPMGVDAPSGFAPYGSILDSTGLGNNGLNYSRVVGSIIGQAGVSGSGAGTYHIPIQVPKGNNGMEPELSISYNSQNPSSGIMGRGWNLSGVSSISTTGRNYYYDGEKGAISEEDTSSCLIWDGQRLFGINAKGLEADSFKTEIKSNAKIEKKSGTDGDYFEILTSTGNTLIYGQSLTAQMHLSETIEWKWLLEEVQDRNGNTIKYTYTKDTQKQQILLSKIEYGGESNDPVNEILFGYSSKAKLKFDYILNYLVVADQKLTSITIKTNDTFVGLYKMNYQTSGSETLLNEVDQYDGDTHSDRYNSTKINWEAPSYNLNPTSSNVSIEWGSNFVYFTGDYNGDGFSDLVSTEFDYNNNEYKYYMYYGSASGLSTAAETGNLPRSYTHRFWDDMKSSLQSECSTTSTSDYTIPDIAYILSGDFDGDGVDELMVKTREWNAFASYLPEDLNSGIENTLWSINGFNGFESAICAYEDYIVDPETKFEEIDLTTFFGNFIHFDEPLNSEDRVTVVRLEGDDETLAKDSRYPDLLGKGYSAFIDDGKAKYYDIENDTAIAFRNTSGGLIWDDFDGDGIGEKIIQEDDNFRFGALSDPIYGTLLGTIDINGDGTSAYAYIGPKEYDYTYYCEEFKDYTGDECDEPIHPSIWIDFVSTYSISDLYSSYRSSNCDLDNSECRTSFLQDTKFDSTYKGQNFKIEHLDGNGPEIDFGNDYFIPTGDDAHVLAADLNADGINELLLFDGNILAKIVYNITPSYSSGNISCTYSDTTISSTGGSTPLKQNISFAIATLMGDFNGDGINEFVTPSLGKKLSFNTSDQAGFTVSGITNGLGQESRYYYKPLTDDDAYTMGTAAEYPVIDFTTTWQVVSSMAIDNGVANPDSSTYSYKEGKIHICGKGFLGYMETNVENHLSNSSIISESRYDDSYFQPFIDSETRKVDGDLVSEIDYRFKVEDADILDSRIFNIKKDTVISQDYLNNVTQTTTMNINSLGQIMQKSVKTGSTATVSESYTYESAGWHYPYLIGSIKKEYDRSGSISSDSSIVSYTSNGQILRVKQFCGTDREVEISISKYDDYGNPERLSKIGNWGQSLAIDSLSIEIDYSSDGRFSTSVKGPMNNNIYNEINTTRGEINSQTTVNDLTTEIEYGSFGFTEKKILPDLKQVHTRIYWAEGHTDAPQGSLYLSWNKVSGTKERLTFCDASGRVLRIIAYDFNGDMLYADSEYDSYGRLSRSSLPYKSGNTPLWSNIAYDDYGRVAEMTAPDSSTTEYTYDELWKKTTITKGNKSRSSELTFNELGEVIESKDAMNNKVFTSYYPNGLVKETFTSVNPTHKIKLSYDVQGNRISIDDPDVGKDTTLFDAFGKLLWRINPKGDTICFDYDKLGRIIKSSDSRGDINFVYISDTTSKAFSMVDSLYSADGSLSESFIYDEDYGRLSSATRRMPDKTFTNSYTYDWYGRLWTRTYPSGYEIEYSYNNGGQLENILGAGTTIWSCNDVNELGQVTSYSQGSYSTTVDYDPFGMLEETTTGSIFNMKFGFDDLGNLNFREDVLTSQKEFFEYDNLSRLTGIDYYLNGIHQASQDLNLTYGNDGNITSKTDVGSTINYGEESAGPHALTSIESLAASYKPPPQLITYTSFNKVSTIQDTIGQDTTLTLEFTYGLNNERVKTVLSRNSTVEQIKYFNGDYEEDSTSTGTKRYHYINSPTGLVGILVQEGTADTLYHVIKDHLGSVSAVINSDTDSIDYFSFNAWGIQRNPDDWSNPFEGELFAGRGYTGHEHIEQFNLINMNGRVYDPVLARFLSPDPYVQFPGVADGLNRYAYVLNNPLIYTDPSGYNSNYFNYLKSQNNYAGGYFYYRGDFYVKSKDRPGFNKYGGIGGGSGSSGYVGGGTYYDWMSGDYYLNGERSSFNQIFSPFNYSRQSKTYKYGTGEYMYVGVKYSSVTGITWLKKELMDEFTLSWMIFNLNNSYQPNENSASNDGGQGFSKEKYYSGGYKQYYGPRPSKEFYPSIPKKGTPNSIQIRNGLKYNYDSNGQLMFVSQVESNTARLYQDALDDSIEYWDKMGGILSLFNSLSRSPGDMVPDSMKRDNTANKIIDITNTLIPEIIDGL